MREFVARMPGVLCLLAAQILWAVPGGAAGALSVGTGPDGPADGYAYGIGFGPDDSDAKSAADALCRTAPNTVPKARDRCALVGMFSGQCVAIALDPKAGTPGAGWGIAADAAAAKDQAMSRCRDTAGAARGAFCQVLSFRCESPAK